MTPSTVIEVRMQVLERKLNEVLRRTGMTDAEVADLELDEVLGHSARTLDFAPLKDLLQKRVKERKGAAA